MYQTTYKDASNNEQYKTQSWKRNVVSGLPLFLTESMGSEGHNKTQIKHFLKLCSYIYVKRLVQLDI